MIPTITAIGKQSVPSMECVSAGSQDSLRKIEKQKRFWPKNKIRKNKKQYRPSTIDFYAFLSQNED